MTFAAAIAFSVSTLAGATGGAAWGAAPQTTPSPDATTLGAPTGAPTPTPTAAPSARPPTPAPTPQPSPTPAYHYIYTPPPQAATAPPDAPRIVEVDFTDRTIHENSDVSLRIVTTPVVQTVILSAMGHDAPVPQTGSGMFAMQMHVPSVPFFFLRTYNVQVRAMSRDGRSDTVTLPVRLAR